MWVRYTEGHKLERRSRIDDGGRRSPLQPDGQAFMSLRIVGAPYRWQELMIQTAILAWLEEREGKDGARIQISYELAQAWVGL